MLVLLIRALTAPLVSVAAQALPTRATAWVATRGPSVKFVTILFLFVVY
jgi:hypothetical protein